MSRWKGKCCSSTDKSDRDISISNIYAYVCRISCKRWKKDDHVMLQPRVLQTARDQSENVKVLQLVPSGLLTLWTNTGLRYITLSHLFQRRRKNTREVFWHPACIITYNIVRFFFLFRICLPYIKICSHRGSKMKDISTMPCSYSTA